MKLIFPRDWSEPLDGLLARSAVAAERLERDWALVPGDRVLLNNHRDGNQLSEFAVHVLCASFDTDEQRVATRLRTQRAGLDCTITGRAVTRVFLMFLLFLDPEISMWVRSKPSLDMRSISTRCSRWLQRGMRRAYASAA